MSARSLVQQYMDRHAMTVAELSTLIGVERSDIYRPTDHVISKVEELMKQDVPFSDAIVV